MSVFTIHSDGRFRDKRLTAGRPAARKANGVDEDDFYLQLYERLRQVNADDATPSLVGRCLTHWWPYPCSERSTSSPQIHARRVSLDRLERQELSGSRSSFWDCGRDQGIHTYCSQREDPASEGPQERTTSLFSPDSVTLIDDAAQDAEDRLASPSWETMSAVSEPTDCQQFDISVFASRLCLPRASKHESLLSSNLSPIPEETSDTASLDINTEPSPQVKHQPVPRRLVSATTIINTR
jgi:hypothetical protein